MRKDPPEHEARRMALRLNDRMPKERILMQVELSSKRPRFWMRVRAWAYDEELRARRKRAKMSLVGKAKSRSNAITIKDDPRVEGTLALLKRMDGEIDTMLEPLHESDEDGLADLALSKTTTPTTRAKP